MPASTEEIARQLEFIASALPSKNVDEISGQKRVTVYVRLLSGQTKAALSYMTERACRELNWFPTPKQCLDILEGYRAAPSLGDKALRKCSDFMEVKFDEFKEALRAGPVEQSFIDEKPHHWLMIAMEQGYLRCEGDGFVQRLPRQQETGIVLDDAA